MFFPWTQSVALAKDESVFVQMDAKLVENDYVWRWRTRMKSASSDGEINFDQSSLRASITSTALLHKAASDYVASLSDEGIRARRVLQLVDGRATLEQIARTLVAEYPEQFGNWHDALKFAASLSQKYSG